MAGMALSCVGLAIIGAVRHYSPIPFWDVWTGYVYFLVQIAQGEYSWWWTGHNEHRIVLSRLLFWLDAHVFGADFKFLIVINYFLLLMIVFTFWRIARNLSYPIFAWLQWFGLMWLCAWIQHENLIWGFQSQFFLAQLLPLLSFYALYLSIRYGQFYFILSIVLGVLSLGTMANGVLALPMMVLFAVLARFSWHKIMVLFVFSVLGLAGYFHGLPSGEGAFTHTLLTQPIAVLKYILFYLGGPFYVLLGLSTMSEILAIFMGAVLIVGSAFVFFKYVTRFSEKPLLLFLLVFILYIGGAALATAVGRAAAFDVTQAASSRYLTPTLMVWVAFLLTLWQLPFCRRYLRSSAAKCVFLVLSVLIINTQLKALEYSEVNEKKKSAAVLALTLGANDPSVIHLIHWRASELLQLIPLARQQRIAIFSVQPYSDILDKLGKSLNLPHPGSCQGYIDKVVLLDENTFRVEGWAFHSAASGTGNFAYVLDETQTVNGAVLTNYERLDVAKVIGKEATYAGFKGYANRQLQGQELSVYFPAANCVLKHKIPQFPYQVKPVNENDRLTVAGLSQVAIPYHWKSDHYEDSHFKNLVTLSSHINGDSDIGSIHFSLEKGNSIFYRSGPVGGRQILRIGQQGKPITLAAFEQWVTLQFDAPDLPEVFEVTLSDEGDGWGEWSAIAVSND